MNTRGELAGCGPGHPQLEAGGGHPEPERGHLSPREGQPRNGTRVSCISCIDRPILHHCTRTPWQQGLCAAHPPPQVTSGQQPEYPLQRPIRVPHLLKNPQLTQSKNQVLPPNLHSAELPSTLLFFPPHAYFDPSLTPAQLHPPPAHITSCSSSGTQRVMTRLPPA